MATTKTSGGVTMTRDAAPPGRAASPTPAGPRAIPKVARPATPAGPRPVPKATRSLASAFATLGDPRTLQVLGLLSSGGPTTQATICAAFGIDTDVANGCVASLKKAGWVEGCRAEESRAYTYRLTEAGSAAWGKAQAFII